MIEIQLEGLYTLAMKNWNWDNLRFLIALAEQRTLSKAAQQLGVSHTTVQRRIHAFEEELEVQLFLHTPDGYQLTSAGKLLFEKGHSLQDTVQTVSRQLAAQEQQLNGSVTVATTDTIGYLLMPTFMQTLSGQHPGLTVNLIINNKHSDLARLEADIAIRTGTKPPESLIGKKLGQVVFCLCASSFYIEGHSRTVQLSASASRKSAVLTTAKEHQFIKLTGGFQNTSFYKWFDENLPNDETLIRTNGLMSAYTLCKSGLGVTMLPSYVAAMDDDLQELTLDPGIELPRNDVWLLNHAELRNNLRVKTVRSALADYLAPFLA